MRTAKGQYGYLRQKAAGGRADAECPVCMSVLGEERRVAVCGHS